MLVIVVVIKYKLISSREQHLFHILYMWTSGPKPQTPDCKPTGALLAQGTCSSMMPFQQTATVIFSPDHFCPHVSTSPLATSWTPEPLNQTKYDINFAHAILLQAGSLVSTSSPSLLLNPLSSFGRYGLVLAYRLHASQFGTS